MTTMTAEDLEYIKTMPTEDLEYIKPDFPRYNSIEIGARIAYYEYYIMLGHGHFDKCNPKKKRRGCYLGEVVGKKIEEECLINVQWDETEGFTGTEWCPLGSIIPERKKVGFQ